MADDSEVLIVGAGLSGAVLARELAQTGVRVQVIEARDHVAGNCHTERDPETGVLVHVYGPHLFHTADAGVWAYVNRFARFRPYRHRVMAQSGGRVYSLPLNLLTINALAAADSVVVPLQCEFFALEGLSQLLSTVEQVKRSLNPRLTIHGIVLTMFDPRNKLATQVVADVRDHMGEKVYETVIPRNVRVSEAPSYGKPALLYDLRCAGSQAYLKLASEIIQRERRIRAA